MERELLVSRIMTPDGTILTSRHRHDYVSHEDANGEYYFLDGGTDYQRCSVNKEPAVWLDLYTDSPYEEVRRVYGRAGRGKNGDQPLKWIPLCEMSDAWLEAAIEYNIEKEYKTFCKENVMYARELSYRYFNNIKIEE